MINIDDQQQLEVSRYPNELIDQITTAKTAWPVRIGQAIVGFGLALAKMVRNIVRMLISAPPEDPLSYHPNREKIVEGALFLLQQAGRDSVRLTTDTMRIAMFLADKWHLDEYGRPVFFDNYVATAAGPLGIAAGEMFEPAFAWSNVGADAAPWTHEKGTLGNVSVLIAVREPDLRLISDSDVDAISSALSIVGALGEDEIRHFTHRNHAYSAAWRNGAGAGSQLDPRLVLEERDDDLIDDLLYISRHTL
ncbi:Panacea domain-containing protein [Sphingomonas sp. S1-29]|uniref:type II toxin-antitoxin system antitoxin SocA domain-containing protein n=1 Tax=Sphingomonas sp. S1-29 TaxID=2991074 RepID=UPI0022403169|nr:type II toxin-antitoxin system antitoxin SocA domain-containing protein [Sphingomonas sp. S1-29]UZK68852.1 Panacea domain-containing protein [Sphingomonas sp. S1-29]